MGFIKFIILTIINN